MNIFNCVKSHYFIHVPFLNIVSAIDMQGHLMIGRILQQRICNYSLINVWHLFFGDGLVRGLYCPTFQFPVFLQDPAFCQVASFFIARYPRNASPSLFSSFLSEMKPFQNWYLGPLMLLCPFPLVKASIYMNSLTESSQVMWTFSSWAQLNSSWGLRWPFSLFRTTLLDSLILHKALQQESCKQPC